MEQDRWIVEPQGKKKNSKGVIAIVVLLAVAIGLLFLLFRKTKVESILLDKTSVTLNVGEAETFSVTVKPEELRPVLIWESSDENIVTVSHGSVMAKNTGNAVVKVSVKDLEDMFAECNVTVIESNVDMQTLDILEEPIVLRPGGHQQMTVSITPENQNEIILWSSTNESVARVSPRGKVEAIKVGVAKIIATSDRTGVADTAVVSVEGFGVIEKNSTVQTNEPQNTQVPAQKTAPVSVAKPAQTPKTTPVAKVNSSPVVTTKTVTPKITKPAQTTVSKPVTSTVSKPATVKMSKPAQTTATKSSGVKDLGYATFKGTWPNDVKGRMVFKSTHVIDSRDPKNRYASPGDYVIGEWSEGHLVQGVWYGSDNKAKGSILIGK